VVGLDFGTTYSGFAYCHVSDENNIRSNDLWHGVAGLLKTNTVLQYDDEYKDVKLWGAPALARMPTRRNRNQENRPVEHFKLHLGDISDKFKPKLPVGHKKAITDYLKEIGKVRINKITLFFILRCIYSKYSRIIYNSKIIKETVSTHWPLIDYFEHVLLVLTVPAEFSERSKAIMRMCAFNAELIKDMCSTNLQFTTERKNINNLYKFIYYFPYISNLKYFIFLF
jgi:hypothetical protein